MFHSPAVSRRYALPLALLSGILLLAGCASTGDERVTRGSLKEAVKKASDDYQGERKVDNSRSTGIDDRSYRHHKGCDRHDRYTITIDQMPSEQGSPPAVIIDSFPLVPHDSAGKIILSLMDFRSSVPLLFTDKMINEIIINARDTVTGNESRYFIKRQPLQNVIPDSLQKPSATRSSKYGVEVVDERYYLGARIFSGLTYSRNYSNISGGSLEWCIQSKPRRRHSFELGGALLPTTRKSDLFGSIDGIGQAFFGYKYRMYTTPDFTLMGLFFSFGGDINAINWDYKNPITSDVYDSHDQFLHTDTIRTDGLWGVGFNTGFGVSLIQTKYVRLSAETSAGTTLYLFDTWEGFHNDMFWGDLFIKAVFEVTFRIK